MSDKTTAALFERGLVQQRAGQHKAAIQIFRQVLKRDETVAAIALCRLGVSYERLNDPQRADAAYAEAIQRQPDGVEAYLRAADLARRASELAERVGQSAAARDLRDGACRYLTTLGGRLMARGAWYDAEMAFRNVRSLAPEDWAVHVDLGRAIAEQGRLEESAALIRRGIALGPGHAPAHFHLGNVLQRQGRAEAAAAEFRRALALDPSLAAAASGLEALGEPRDDADPAGSAKAPPDPD